MSPAPVRVRVSVSRVDERVFERPADVVGGQAGHGRHHVARKLTDTQRPPVLTSPPVVLCPENTHIDRNKRISMKYIVLAEMKFDNNGKFLLSLSHEYTYLNV